jgi:hypothetical protein
MEQNHAELWTGIERDLLSELFRTTPASMAIRRGPDLAQARRLRRFA